MRRKPTRQVFGLTFTRATASGVADRIIGEAVTTGLRLVVTPNLDHIRHLRRPSFARACAAATLVCADGWPVAVYAGFRQAASWQRVTGCDLMHALMTCPAFRQKRVFAVVESQQTADALHSWLTATDSTPPWSIAIAPRNLAGSDEAQGKLAAAIALAAPDILVMTLGAPISEVFVHTHGRSLPPCWAICIGQALRIELGLVERAPRVLRRLGLEWAWRICQEPRRLARRYVAALTWFPWAIATDIFHQNSPDGPEQ